MKVAIEGPPLKDVDFSAIMNIFKQKIGTLNFNLNNYKNKKYMENSWGGIPELPPPLYEPLPFIRFSPERMPWILITYCVSISIHGKENNSNFSLIYYSFS